MKILVTGVGGQLGRELFLRLQANAVDVIGIGRNDVDFSTPEKVADVIASYKADWVINCAAYTNVDKAEEESDLAFQVNKDSARAVAEGVRSYGGRLVHISTDFIFDGKQSSPYLENDTVNPLGSYGQSKWQGECSVQEILPDAIILRTAWVYGVHGNNFVKTMLRLAAQCEELRVVDDQIGTPTWTADIVDAVLSLIKSDASGVYNFTNEGVASWYDFAVAIVDEGVKLGFPGKAQQITPISTKDYPTPAIRPAYSVLSKIKTRTILNRAIPHWRDSLHTMLKELKQVTD